MGMGSGGMRAMARANIESARINADAMLRNSRMNIDAQMRGQQADQAFQREIMTKQMGMQVAMTAKSQQGQLIQARGTTLSMVMKAMIKGVDTKDSYQAETYTGQFTQDLQQSAASGMLPMPDMAAMNGARASDDEALNKSFQDSQNVVNNWNN